MGLIFEVAEGGALDIDVKIEGIFTLIVKISDYFFLLSLEFVVREKLKSKFFFRPRW